MRKLQHAFNSVIVPGIHRDILMLPAYILSDFLPHLRLGATKSAQFTSDQSLKLADRDLRDRKQATAISPPTTATADESILREFEPIHAGAAG